MNRATAALLALTSLTACAGPQRKAADPKPSACEPRPQWYAYDPKGVPVRAVLVCFREDGALTWAARPLTLDELEKLSQPTAAAPAPPDPGMMALAKKSEPHAKKARRRHAHAEAE